MVGMDWNGFKFFLAVAHHGTVRGAAKALGVNPSTVTRRIEQLEARLGVKLFIRREQSLTLTAVGASAAAGLEGIERDLSSIEHSLRSSEGELAGPVRVAAPGFLLLGGLANHLDDFVNAHADIRIEWLDARAPDAPFDVALAMTSAPPLDLIGRQVGAVGWSLYGHHALVGRLERKIGWIDAEGLALEDSCASIVSKLKSGCLDEAPTTALCQGLSRLLALLRAGVGVAALPCLLGDADAELRRLPDAQVVREPLWLLKTPESRGTRRVRAFVEHLQRAVETIGPRLSGG